MLESEQESLQRQLADPALYQQNSDEVSTLSDRFKQVETELESAYQRWEELEEKST